ncbi:hypothetical protein M153_5840002771 [Pseudoloma neurophilia]|uniref:Uncharacterized protein n=1 Tax=Pseudoloma neurophilia TaxID=146866 RepID=A0A0R0LX80_9MICR|nr:hypothetical protein M153_5840002771 [Pseudoloma neurophilia]
MTQNDSLQNSQDTGSESSTTSEETNFTLKKFDCETQNNSFSEISDELSTSLSESLEHFEDRNTMYTRVK